MQPCFRFCCNAHQCRALVGVGKPSPSKTCLSSNSQDTSHSQLLSDALLHQAAAEALDLHHSP